MPSSSGSRSSKVCTKGQAKKGSRRAPAAMALRASLSPCRPRTVWSTMMPGFDCDREGGPECRTAPHHSRPPLRMHSLPELRDVGYPRPTIGMGERQRRSRRPRKSLHAAARTHLPDTLNSSSRRQSRPAQRWWWGRFRVVRQFGLSRSPADRSATSHVPCPLPPVRTLGRWRPRNRNSEASKPSQAGRVGV